MDWVASSSSLSEYFTKRIRTLAGSNHASFGVYKGLKLSESIVIGSPRIYWPPGTKAISRKEAHFLLERATEAPWRSGLMP